MNRLTNYEYLNLITEAYDVIPLNILKLVNHVHFFTGVDPVYAGLEIDEVIDNRHIRNCCHFLPESRQLLPKSLQYPTIVLQEASSLITPEVIVHELGHVLDDVTLWYVYETDIKPVTEYAKTNFREAFAEAFVSWLYWNYGEDVDEETLALFERLKSRRL